MENEILKEYISVLEDKKLKNIEAFDLSGKSEVAKFIIIATANSEKVSRQVANEIKAFFEEKNKTSNLEGEFPGDWIILDFGDVLIEILTEEARNYYNLEKLWGDSKNRLAQPSKKRKKKVS